MSIEQKAIRSEAAPAPLGPFSHAIQAGNFLFTSGQTGVDPATGQLAGPGLEEQLRQIFNNIRAVLTAAGANLDNVVKTTVFLKRMSDFAEMNALYAREFGDHRPARSTVEVSRLPGNALVEIETVAMV